MRRCNVLQRRCLALFAPWSKCQSLHSVLVVSLMLLATPGAGWTPLKISIRDCGGLKNLPFPMTEDVDVFIDGVRDIACNSVTTISVIGNHELHLSSSSPTLSFTNVRFVVHDESTLTVDVDDDVANNGGTTVTFQGVNGQESDGGVLEVKHGGSAVFLVPVHFEGNSVSDGFSGGALHVDGLVNFVHAAHFWGNQASTLVPSGGGSSCGGAVSVGEGGNLNFFEFTSFEENSSERGGALCNRGSTIFDRRTFFTGNSAFAVGKDDGVVGGDGGAVYTQDGSQTVFSRRCTMHGNSASDSGGGVFNGGDMEFVTSAAFWGNQATCTSTVSEIAGGGHLFNMGMLNIKGDVSFREGSSGADGGAVYTPPGGVTVLGGIATFDDNSADGECDDLFSSLKGKDVKLTTSRPTKGAATTATARRRRASLARTTPCQP